jgi:hypothetical protein
VNLTLKTRFRLSFKRRSEKSTPILIFDRTDGIFINHHVKSSWPQDSFSLEVQRRAWNLERRNPIIKQPVVRLFRRHESGHASGVFCPEVWSA